jgi:hypothetical protein
MKVRDILLLATIVIILCVAMTYTGGKAQAQGAGPVRIIKVNPRVQTTVQVAPGQIVGFSCVPEVNEVQCFIASTN